MQQQAEISQPKAIWVAGGGTSRIPVPISTVEKLVSPAVVIHNSQRVHPKQQLAAVRSRLQAPMMMLLKPVMRPVPVLCTPSQIRLLKPIDTIKVMHQPPNIPIVVGHPPVPNSLPPRGLHKPKAVARLVLNPFPQRALTPKLTSTISRMVAPKAMSKSFTRTPPVTNPPTIRSIPPPKTMTLVAVLQVPVNTVFNYNASGSKLVPSKPRLH